MFWVVFKFFFISLLGFIDKEDGDASAQSTTLEKEKENEEQAKELLQKIFKKVQFHKLCQCYFPL